MRTIRIDCGFEIKAINDDGHIEGYASVFGNVDHGFDRVERGAFKDWLADSGGVAPILWQHDAREPIGLWHDMDETRKGLYAVGQLNLSQDSGGPDVPEAWKARALAKQGAVTGLSIGYHAVDFRFEDDVRVLEKLAVIETSMVTFPMNPEARVTGAKHMTRKELEHELRDRLGISRHLASRAAYALRDELKRDSREDSSIEDSANTLLQQLRGN